MSTMTPQILTDLVGASLSEALASQPVKRTGHRTGLSRQTLGKARAGTVPGRTRNFLWTLWRLEAGARRRILAPLIGATSAADLTDHLMQSSRTLEATVADLARILGPLGLSGDPALLVGGEAHPAPEPAHRSLAGPGEDGRGRAGAPAAALPPADRGRDQGSRIPGEEAPAAALAPAALILEAVERDAADGAALRRLLDPLSPGRIDLALAERVVAADASGRLGFAWARPGEDWVIRPGHGNRFWAGATGPQPLAAFPAPNHISALRRGFDLAVASARLLVFDHVGVFRRGDELMPIASRVVRLGGIDRDGTRVVASAFERLAA